MRIIRQRSGQPPTCPSCVGMDATALRLQGVSSRNCSPFRSRCARGLSPQRVNSTPGSGCIHVDPYGRLFPSPLRFPSTRVNTTVGSWKPFVDKASEPPATKLNHSMLTCQSQQGNDGLDVACDTRRPTRRASGSGST